MSSNFTSIPKPNSSKYYKDSIISPFEPSVSAISLLNSKSTIGLNSSNLNNIYNVSRCNSNNNNNNNISNGKEGKEHPISMEEFKYTNEINRSSFGFFGYESHRKEIEKIGIQREDISFPILYKVPEVKLDKKDIKVSHCINNLPLYFPFSLYELRFLFELSQSNMRVNKGIFNEWIENIKEGKEYVFKNFNQLIYSSSIFKKSKDDDDYNIYLNWYQNSNLNDNTFDQMNKRIKNNITKGINPENRETQFSIETNDNYKVLPPFGEDALIINTPKKNTIISNSKAFDILRNKNTNSPKGKYKNPFAKVKNDEDANEDNQIVNENGKVKEMKDILTNPYINTTPVKKKEYNFFSSNPHLDYYIDNNIFYGNTEGLFLSGSFSSDKDDKEKNNVFKQDINNKNYPYSSYKVKQKLSLNDDTNYDKIIYNAYKTFSETKIKKDNTNNTHFNNSYYSYLTQPSFKYSSVVEGNYYNKFKRKRKANQKEKERNLLKEFKLLNIKNNNNNTIITSNKKKEDDNNQIVIGEIQNKSKSVVYRLNCFIHMKNNNNNKNINQDSNISFVIYTTEISLKDIKLKLLNELIQTKQSLTLNDILNHMTIKVQGRTFLNNEEIIQLNKLPVSKKVQKLFSDIFYIDLHIYLRTIGEIEKEDIEHKDYYPKSKKFNFNILEREMTFEEIKHIENFEMSNYKCSIIFEGICDLTYADLDIIDVDNKNIRVVIDKTNDYLYHKIPEKIIVNFKDVFLEDEDSEEGYIKEIVEKCINNLKTETFNYDKENQILSALIDINKL